MPDKEAIARLNSREAVAVHEAGHVLVAATHGDLIGRVLIEETADGWRGRFRRCPQVPPTANQDGERLVAGDIAQYEFLGIKYERRVAEGEPRSDLARAMVIARAERPNNPADWLDIILGTSQKTLHRGRHWEAMLALGARIDAAGLVSGREALDIVQSFGLRTRNRELTPHPLPDDAEHALDEEDIFRLR